MRMQGLIRTSTSALRLDQRAQHRAVDGAAGAFGHAPMSEERMTESVCSLAVPKPNQGLPMKLKKKILETQ